VFKPRLCGGPRARASGHFAFKAALWLRRCKGRRNNYQLINTRSGRRRRQAPAANQNSPALLRPGRNAWHLWHVADQGSGPAHFHGNRGPKARTHWRGLSADRKLRRRAPTCNGGSLTGETERGKEGSFGSALTRCSNRRFGRPRTSGELRLDPVEPSWRAKLFGHDKTGGAFTGGGFSATHRAVRARTKRGGVVPNEIGGGRSREQPKCSA